MEENESGEVYDARMPGARTLREELRNFLQYGDLTFRDFMELALYHPELGYYARAENPVGKGRDYVTAPSLSPVFSFAIAGLVREFLSRCEGAVSTIVDVGCGDGSLIRDIARQVGDGKFFGVDRSLSRLDDSSPRNLVDFVQTIDQVPASDCTLIFSNELFDAFPVARLVQRGEHLHELWVNEREGELDWSEHEAPAPYDDYFAERGIALAEGQFADVSLEWELYYEDLSRRLTRGLIVTIDYGFAQQKLFHSRIRRFGTAAAYAQQRVTRDLLANPGEQDLTAHINFTDLESAGTRHGLTTRFFDSLAKFLLAIGITDHDLFRPVHEIVANGAEEGLALLQAREDARRLILPDGIGEDLRVLVQEKGMGAKKWSFEQRLF